jgi:hypothetical protein
MRSSILFVLAAALASATCSSVTAPSANKTETFSGTIEPKPSANYIKFFTFQSTNNGEAEVKITAMSPVTNVFIGTFLGQPQTDGSCGFLLPPNEFSVLNRASVNEAVNKGPYCTGFYDPGTLSQPLTVTLTVSHP